MFDLGTLGAALTSAKAIGDLLRNAHDAELAMAVSREVANLQGKLIEVQQQALALQNENQNLHDEIKQLNSKLAETVEAEPCPSCQRKGWHVESSQPDRIFGAVGCMRRVYKCRFCGFTESRVV